MKCQRCESKDVQIGDLLKGTPDVCLNCGYVQRGLIERIEEWFIKKYNKKKEHWEENAIIGSKIT